MAKQVKQVDKAKGGIAKADYQRVVKEVLRQRAKAKEAASSAGGYVKNQMENHDFDRLAFNWALKLEGMESNRRNEALRNLFLYIDLGDLLAQADLFDDVFTTMRRIIETREAMPERPPVDPAIGTLVN